MKPNLKPGTYSLVQNVENPKPDRRMRHDWRAEPLFKAGRTFIVSLEPEGLAVRAADGWAHQWLYIEHHSIGRALVNAGLRPVAEAPSDYLRREAWEHLAPSVLDRLHAMGAITMDQVVAALRAELES